MNDLIVGTGLKKDFRLSREITVQALRGAELAVGEGEFVSIVGPSGSGKSTLLHLIGLLDVPSGGRLMLDGEDVSRLNDGRRTELRAEKIGFVFQTFNLLPALTALENVEFAMRNVRPKLRLTREERWKRAAEGLAKVGMEKRVRHPPSKLSGGERQRVAIARALANRPRLLLADEPTGNLDSASTAGILSLLHEVHAAGTTVIMVTHNPETTRDTRVVQLKDGRIS
jgi:putative ABC transport system ATP-binding protein